MGSAFPARYTKEGAARGRRMLVSAIFLVFALFVLAARWFTSPADRRRSEILLLSLLLAFPAIRFAEFLAGGFVSLLASCRPQRYDLYINRFDGLFGHPSFFLGRWVASSHFLTALVAQVYEMPVTVMLAVFIVYAYLREDEKFLVARAFLFNLFLALPLYIAFPVCGPKYAFPGFPRYPGPVPAHVVAIAAPPNGVPSVHNSIAMLCAAFLWRWKWGRVVGSLFVALTVLATLANGEHYVFDVLSAIPFTLLVWKVTHLSWGVFRVSSAPIPPRESAEAHP